MPPPLPPASSRSRRRWNVCELLREKPFLRAVLVVVLVSILFRASNDDAVKASGAPANVGLNLTPTKLETTQQERPIHYVESGQAARDHGYDGFLGALGAPAVVAGNGPDLSDRLGDGVPFGGRVRGLGVSPALTRRGYGHWH